MKWIGLLFLSALPASTAVLPGSPPWLCSPAAACSPDDCLALPTNLARFRVDPSPEHPHLYVTSTLGEGQTHLAPQPSLAAAATWLRETEDKIAAILVATDFATHVDDYALYSVVKHADGVWRMNGDHLILLCGPEGDG
ncbi:MAG: hypothetical protein QNJ13_09845 [Paracoccaceae bacterium]|nr:hypothetical protein [Paracoccaceae bacterium]